MQSELKNKLLEIVGADCLIENAPMKDQIAFRVGGTADFLIMPESAEQLINLIQLLKKENAPFYLMGNGSNLLVRDGGFRGTVIKTRGMDNIEVRGDVILAEAGAMLRKIAAVALDHDLTGLEFASGIPGTLGGAVVMNAGAYGSEMKDIIESVDVLTAEGEEKTLSMEDCDFSYRHSLIGDRGDMVLRARLRLQPGNHDTIKATMKDLNGRRREKQPLEYPSAGSTFKRPEGYFAGKLIQDCGLKGFSIGGAAVSEKHAGFIINQDHATAKDVTDVIVAVQQKVKEQFGVELKTEVIIIGEEMCNLQCAMCNYG